MLQIRSDAETRDSLKTLERYPQPSPGGRPRKRYARRASREGDDWSKLAGSRNGRTKVVPTTVRLVTLNGSESDLISNISFGTAAGIGVVVFCDAIALQRQRKQLHSNNLGFFFDQRSSKTRHSKGSNPSLGGNVPAWSHLRQIYRWSSISASAIY